MAARLQPKESSVDCMAHWVRSGYTTAIAEGADISDQLAATVCAFQANGLECSRDVSGSDIGAKINILGRSSCHGLLRRTARWAETLHGC